MNTENSGQTEGIYSPHDFEYNTASHASGSDAVCSNQPYIADVLQRLRKNKIALLSLFFILLTVLFAVFAPLVSPYTYRQINTAHSNLSPRIPYFEKLGVFNGVISSKVGGVTQQVNIYEQKDAMGSYHYFGTDNLGRDIWTRTAEGTRISLMIAGIAISVDMCIGVLFGMISGYIGGMLDIFMQRFVEIVNGIPTIVIITLLLVMLKPGLASIIIAIIFSGWINMSRIVRAHVLKLKEQEYVLASKTLGASGRMIIFGDLLPNTLGLIIITFMFSIPNAIFLEAFLAFIGLGVPEPLASLGTLINDGYKSATTYPYMIIFPALVLGFLMLSFNLLADGLCDAIDPRLKNI
jgi:oligopeptide transport system permease protein